MRCILLVPLRLIGGALRAIMVGVLAVAMIAGGVAFADYTATQGSGTTFASIVIATKHYMAMALCDATAGETQCAAVNSSGQVAIQAPPTLPLPTGGSTAANQTATQPRNIAQMGGTAIASGCTAALSGFSTTIPATICPVMGTYVINTNPNVGNNGDGVAAGATAGSPVIDYSFVFNGTTWDRQRSGSVTGSALATPVPTSTAGQALSHVSGASASLTSLVAKASAGNLYAYNCTAVAGATAGFCVAYNGTTAPSTGALTAANVLDFCYFGATAAGCSLSRIPMGVNYSTGIVILVTSAATPYTYTTGTDTAAITADVE